MRATLKPLVNPPQVLLFQKNLQYRGPQRNSRAVKSLLIVVRSDLKSSLVRREDFTNWKKLGESLSEHENSLNSKNCYCSWKNLDASLEKRGIVKDLQDEIEKEESHWEAVFDC
ncbi:hypothetical protein AVEN_240128-1 [Araneus ventricosus]|uniref:Uncharacterized protein n=1 Tax=Araneus ventricosus TaxID=182803 RepID=A0A4Y2RF71_ARAVE|nr:hypothetical protein AVEN_240128-1 [Araneus ventricosus]